MAQRIMVRAPQWLGDAVMATPFVKRLGKQFPAAEVEVWVKGGLAGIFERAPGVTRVFAVNSGEGPWALGRRIRQRQYETAYILPPSFSSALACAWGRVPRRVGYPTDARRLLLTEAPRLDERFHYVRRYLGLLGEAGADIARSDFHVPQASADETARLLEKGEGRSKGKVLALAPGSRASARRWFPDRFADVVNGLGAEWGTVILLGAKEDRPVAREVAQRCRRPTLDLCGQTPLPLAASILARSAALLSNESGLMHLGWAVGTPIVVVAGPSDPQVTSPFGSRVRVIQARDLPCVPCIRNECYRPREDHKLCMQRISSADVLRELASLKTCF